LPGLSVSNVDTLPVRFSVVGPPLDRVLSVESVDTVSVVLESVDTVSVFADRWWRLLPDASLVLVSSEVAFVPFSVMFVVSVLVELSPSVVPFGDDGGVRAESKSEPACILTVPDSVSATALIV